MADIGLGRIGFRNDFRFLADIDVRDRAFDDFRADDVRNGRFEIEQGRDVQGRGAGARIGVATDDLAVHRRAGEGQVFVILRLGQLRLGGLHGGLLRTKRGIGSGDGVLGLVELLLGDEVGRRQLFQTVEFALRRRQGDLGQGQLALGLIDAGYGRLHGQALRVVFLTGQNLTLGDIVAFLNEDLADRAGCAGGHFDDAAFDIDLAVGDGRIGRRRHLDGSLAAGRAGALLASLQRQPGRGQEDQAERGHTIECTGHLASLQGNVQRDGGSDIIVSERILPSSMWMTRSA